MVLSREAFHASLFLTGEEGDMLNPQAVPKHADDVIEGRLGLLRVGPDVGDLGVGYVAQIRGQTRRLKTCHVT